jgi:phosphoenolpyruvate---glycerone phosphotransferase subunit DhaL
VIDSATVTAFFQALLAAFEREREAIDRLDAVAGDGDCGSTMVIGLRAVTAAPPEAGAGPADVLRAAAARFATVGGSAGPLWGTGLLRAAQALERRGSAEPGDLAAALEAAVAGMAERGRSREGERTLLDVMGPAARALAEAAGDGRTGAEALGRAVDAAEAGLEATREMTPLRGRAERAPERVRGHPDAGALAAVIAWRTAATLAGA